MVWVLGSSQLVVVPERYPQYIQTGYHRPNVQTCQKLRDEDNPWNISWNALPGRIYNKQNPSRDDLIPEHIYYMQKRGPRKMTDGFYQW